MVVERCIFCRQPLRTDGTCSTPKCPLYVPEPPVKNDGETTEAKGSDTTTEQP